MLRKYDITVKCKHKMPLFLLLQWMVLRLLCQIANFDFSIAFKSSVEMDFILSSLSSSLKVLIPFWSKAAYKWSVKLLRVSSPLKLRKTSYSHVGNEEEAISEVMEAIGNLQSFGVCDISCCFWLELYYHLRVVPL